MYIVIVDFGNEDKKIYTFNDLKSAAEVYNHATDWGLKVKIYNDRHEVIDL